MNGYTELTNLYVSQNLSVGGTVDIDGIKAVAENEHIVEVDKAASTAPTKAEFDALVAVVNALSAALGRAED